MPEFHPTAPSAILRTNQPHPPPGITILGKHSGGEDREEENLDSTEFVEVPYGHEISSIQAGFANV
jgi:hypothetical protein